MALTVLENEYHEKQSRGAMPMGEFAFLGRERVTEGQTLMNRDVGW